MAGAGLLGGAGISGLIGRVLAAGNSPALQGIRRMSGKVEVNGSSAGQGQRILPGDTVTTGADGEVVYVIGENAFLQRARSSVSFGDSATAGVLRIISGKLLSVFGKGPQKIVASTATIGIRGTGCYIESAPDLVYFCLCYGEADLVPTAAPAEQELIKTTHHDRPLYIHNDMKMPTMMVPAGVINHTDLELTLLESLVGRLPPFAGKRPYLSG
ncbi:MAG: hypothetical protein D4S02_01470 [Rhodocyclaceae bacterium]|nr:MAG: hypothetical protein D4S02_01470 [Rhodocyclaceae bacterium]